MSDVGHILRRVGFKLAREVSPALRGHYTRGDALMAGMLAVMAGEAWDGAADRLHREVEGMRALLRAGGVAAEETPASLQIAHLERVRDIFAERLISLQAELEEADSEAARALNARIWSHLLAGARERMPSVPTFEDAVR